MKQSDMVQQAAPVLKFFSLVIIYLRKCDLIVPAQIKDTDAL